MNKRTDVQKLAEIIRGDLRELEGRLNQRIDAVRDKLHAVGGDITVRLDRLEPLVTRSVAAAERCADKIMVVESDARAISDRFLPKAENERRHRAVELAVADLEKARDDLRGRTDDIEQQLRIVQARGT